MAASPAVTEKPSKQIGRPSIRSKALAAMICSLIAEGKSLRSICRDERMPSPAAVFTWLTEDKEFQEQYAVARKVQAELLAEECLEIADSAFPENAQVARLQVDTRKWWAGKMHPRYADRPNETHVTSVTNNNLILLDEGRLKELQERRQAQLLETVKDA